MAISKRRKAFAGKVNPTSTYPVLDAFKLVKDTATAKFDESVDVAVNLGIDAKKSDQTVRGSVVLPAGTGKKVRVAVFAQGDKAQAAKAAGAVTLNLGVFINTIISFIIIAFAVFLVIKGMNTLKRQEEAAPTTKECPFCFSAIPLKASRCPHCTSELKAA